MESRAKAFGHAIHPMLIPFPLGLLSTAVIFDIIHFITGKADWSDAAFYMIAAGIIGGLAAAVFGLIDWLAVPSGTRAKAVGLYHGGGNVVVVVLFAISWVLRYSDYSHPSGIAFILALVALCLAAVTGWLGGELVERLSVGVDEGANLNAPNSLTGQQPTGAIGARSGH
jgi:uncharacterized membrane protein